METVIFQDSPLAQAIDEYSHQDDYQLSRNHKNKEISTLSVSSLVTQALDCVHHALLNYCLNHAESYERIIKRIIRMTLHNSRISDSVLTSVARESLMSITHRIQCNLNMDNNLRIEKNDFKNLLEIHIELRGYFLSLSGRLLRSIQTLQLALAYRKHTKQLRNHIHAYLTAPFIKANLPQLTAVDKAREKMYDALVVFATNLKDNLANQDDFVHKIDLNMEDLCNQWEISKLNMRKETLKVESRLETPTIENKSEDKKDDELRNVYESLEQESPISNEMTTDDTSPQVYVAESQGQVKLTREERIQKRKKEKLEAEKKRIILLTNEILMRELTHVIKMRSNQ